MIILILFAFIAGVVTILSPCILPILPVLLSGSLGSKARPMGIIVGFVGSFTFFTLFLSSIVQLLGISADALRIFSMVVIFLFGLSLLIPQIQTYLEVFFSKFSGGIQSQRKDFLGGILIGLSLGLLWTPCVGPILASVISLALTGTVNTLTFFITLAYAAGTAIPMFIIMLSGKWIFIKIPWLLRNTATIQKGFGIVMMLLAIAIFFNFDKKFQAYVLEKFPAYGAGLTKLEDNQAVKQQINNIGNKKGELTAVPNIPGEQVKLKNFGKAAEIIPGGQWVNSEPLTIASLKGKVILVDFWTYTCINCIRTLPYLRDWHERYSNKGLVIVGVHTPEFEFEKNIKNLQNAVKQYKLSYPIVQDNNFATWNAYSNRYWPAKYLIDANGIIRYVHFGEGEYDATESAIRALLKEAGIAELPNTENNTEYRIYSRTPESYLGYARIARFASPEKIKENVVSLYSYPKNLLANYMAFSGAWMVGEEYAGAKEEASLKLNFDAKEVFLVMKPTATKLPAKVQVYLDGVLVKEAAGEDVVGGFITVNEDRLYKLINLPTPGRHTLELKFPSGNVEVFAFTFG